MVGREVVVGRDVVAMIRELTYSKLCTCISACSAEFKSELKLSKMLLHCISSVSSFSRFCET